MPRRNGTLEEGWKEYKLAQELDPNQDHLSGPLFSRGDYDGSIEVLQKALESRPKDAVLRYSLLKTTHKRVYTTNGFGN